MIKNPIQDVTNKLQYRAIGIVKGIYKPNNIDQLNRGTLTDKQGKIIETVILGKALALIRKYINLDKDEHLVRFHIGLEDPKDLIADIKQALKHLK